MAWVRMFSSVDLHSLAVSEIGNETLIHFIRQHAHIHSVSNAVKLTSVNFSKAESEIG